MLCVARWGDCSGASPPPADPGGLHVLPPRFPALRLCHRVPPWHRECQSVGNLSLAGRRRPRPGDLEPLSPSGLPSPRLGLARTPGPGPLLGGGREAHRLKPLSWVVADAWVGCSGGGGGGGGLGPVCAFTPLPMPLLSLDPLRKRALPPSFLNLKVALWLPGPKPGRRRRGEMGARGCWCQA